MTTATTDTPRCEAARFEALRGLALRQDCIPLKLGEELERELTEAQSINNKVTKELWMWTHGEMRSERLIKELNATRAALEQMTEDVVRMRNLLE
jgi:hypothetical protein